MKRCPSAAMLALLLAACGGGGGGEAGGGEGAEMSSACDVPQAGQCATITTLKTAWDMAGGEAAWAKQCATGAAGYAGTVVASCPTADRVGRCAVTYTSVTASAVVVYGYYASAYSSDLAVETCAALRGSYSGG